MTDCAEQSDAIDKAEPDVRPEIDESGIDPFSALQEQAVKIHQALDAFATIENESMRSAMMELGGQPLLRPHQRPVEAGRSFLQELCARLQVLGCIPAHIRPGMERR